MLPKGTNSNPRKRVAKLVGYGLYYTLVIVVTWYFLKDAPDRLIMGFLGVLLILLSFLLWRGWLWKR